MNSSLAKIQKLIRHLPATTTKASVAAVRRRTTITTIQLSLRNGIRKVPHAMSLPCIDIHVVDMFYII